MVTRRLQRLEAAFLPASGQGDAEEAEIWTQALAGDVEQAREFIAFRPGRGRRPAISALVPFSAREAGQW
ncbi:MAG: hypothetical protein HYX95_03500 [Chloroflexi bacterium]|nr:hypothetical protein [Chloroflexota bacterium]